MNNSPPSALDYESTSLPSASDYRGNPNNKDRIESQNATTVKMYSNVVRQNQTPNKELGVILMAPNREINTMEYIRTIGNIVTPKNITHASWMGNNRFSIFLKDMTTLNKFMLNRNSVLVGATEIPIRRLITPAKRIILSGIMPYIPDTEIENILKQNGLQIVSAVTHLKIANKDDEYSHILSFRRQVFIVPPESGEIPYSIELIYENEKFRVYLESDKLICYKCKSEGHMAMTCHNLSLPQNHVQDRLEINVSNTTDDATLEQLENVRRRNNEKRLRQHTSSDASSDASTNGETSSKAAKLIPAEPLYIDVSQIPPTLLQKAVNARKRIKTNSEESELTEEKTIEESESPKQKTTEELLSPIKQIMNEDPEDYCLTYTDLYNFINELKGNPNKIAVCKSYTTELNHLRDTLIRLYPHLEDRNMKNQFTRIQKRITCYLNGNEKMEISSSDTEIEEDRQNTPQSPISCQESYTETE